MQAVLVITDGRVYWRASLDSPAYVQLRSVPGYALVSPFAVRCRSLRQHEASGLAFHHAGQYVMMNQPFLLMGKVPPTREALRLFECLLQHLRSVASQPTLPLRTISAEPLSECEVPTRFPAPQERGSAKILRSTVASALSLEQCARADTAACEGAPPETETLLIDALQALQLGDFRRAILFAAIAVEVAASGELERIMLDAMRRPEKALHLRIREVPAGPGGRVLKDPVYEALEGQKSSFRALLHERFLYVGGRSLLLDDEPVFAAAVRLYKTRNRIAHEGTAEQKDLLPIDDGGAREALETAVDVLRWLGVRSDYIMPNLELLDVDMVLFDRPVV